MMMRICLFLLLVLCGMARAADQPVTIEASDQLEWLRAENKYRATKDVVITQGDTVIRGDVATASYDPAQGPSALTELQVTGHVIITQPSSTITADHGVYDTMNKHIVLTGQQVKLVSPDVTMTSSGPVDYFVDERKIVSKGQTTVQQKEQTLQAHSATAWFSAATNALEKAVADGDVIITKQTDKGKEVARAEHAVYDAKANNVLLTKNVRLARGDNFMQGERATIDLITGYSTLQNDQQKNGRVRAIFSTAKNSSSVAPPSVPVKIKTRAPQQMTSTPPVTQITTETAR